MQTDCMEHEMYEQLNLKYFHPVILNILKQAFTL